MGVVFAALALGDPSVEGTDGCPHHQGGEEHTEDADGLQPAVATHPADQVEERLDRDAFADPVADELGRRRHAECETQQGLHQDHGQRRHQAGEHAAPASSCRHLFLAAQ
ncbi:MAG: hypothetical protein ACR2HY_10715 [Acidimicrobiales bacterium]